MDLKKYREEIDAIDKKLLDLFFERMNIASEIAEYKKSGDIAVFDRKRESEKLESICRNSPEGMSDYARQLYLKIFELSRKHQGSIFRCGLLGEKLGHSFSPEIHSEFGRYSYDLFECPRENLGDFIRNGEWDGLNVTIPYKKEVLQYCDRLSETVKKTGSVNTLVRRDGCIFGYNTDYY